jgi:hypothetical protein
MILKAIKIIIAQYIAMRIFAWTFFQNKATMAIMAAQETNLSAMYISMALLLYSAAFIKKPLLKCDSTSVPVAGFIIIEAARRIASMTKPVMIAVMKKLYAQIVPVIVFFICILSFSGNNNQFLR